MKLCAGRTAQEINLTKLGSDAGISHKGLQPGLFHYREARGVEIDLLYERGEDIVAAESKSGATLNNDFFKNLKKFTTRMKNADRSRTVRSHVVYGGEDRQQRSYAHVLPWRDVQRIISTV